MTDDRRVPEGAFPNDWASRATRGIEQLVALVRDHSLRPALTVLRFALLGLLASVLGALVLVLGMIGLIRLLTVDAFSGRVWASDLAVGVVILLGGASLLMVSRRIGRESTDG